MRNSLQIRRNGLPVDRWETSLFDEMDRLFEGLWEPRRALGERSFAAPVFEVEESENAYLLSLDLPGMSKEDISIDVSENVLKIAGERRRQNENKDEHYFHTQRQYGKFERSFSLPANVDTAQIEANHANGVLQILLPKSAGAKARRVQVGTQETGLLSQLFGKKEAKNIN